MEKLLNSICDEFVPIDIDKNILHVCCYVEISLNVHCIRTDADNTAINNIYFYSLLSIDKMKENNQHNEILKMIKIYKIC